MLVASSLAAFVGARPVVRPGQPHATYALGDDKTAALAILLPYRPPAARCVVGPKHPLCFFVEPQPASSRHRHRASSARKSTLTLIPDLLLIVDLRGPESEPYPEGTESRKLAGANSCLVTCCLPIVYCNRRLHSKPLAGVNECYRDISTYD